MAKKKKREERQAERAQAKLDRGTEKTNKILENQKQAEQKSDNKFDQKVEQAEQKVEKVKNKVTKKVTKEADKAKSTQAEILKKGSDGSISKEEEQKAIDKNKEKFKNKAGKITERLSGDDMATKRAKSKLAKGTEETNKALSKSPKFSSTHPMNIPNPKTGKMMTTDEANKAVIDSGFQDEVDPLAALKGKNTATNNKNEALNKAISEAASNPAPTADEIVKGVDTEQLLNRFDGVSQNAKNEIKKGILGASDKISALSAAMQGKGSGGFQGTTADIANARNTSLDDSFAANTEENRGLLGLMNRYSDAPAAAEKITNQDLFPDIGVPLQKGTYSGRTTGSVPIFAAGGGYVPLGIIDSRKRALRTAAKKKAEEGEKLAELVYAKGAVEYQDQINDMSNDLLEEYGEMVGYDWDKLNDGSALSLKFYKAVQDHQAFAAETLRYDEVANQVIEDGYNNEIYVPKSTIQGASEYVKGKMNLSNMKKDPEAWKNLGEWANKYQNLKDVYNKQKGGIEKTYSSIIADRLDDPTVSTELKDNYAFALRGGDFDIISTAQAKLIGDERLREITDAIHKSSNLYNTPQETYDYFRLNLSTDVTSKQSIIKKSNSGWGNDKEPKVQLYTDARAALMSPELKNGFKTISNVQAPIASKEEMAIAKYEESTNGKIIPNNGGRLQSKVVLTPTQQNKKVNESAVNVEIYNSQDGKYYSYDDMMAMSLKAQNTISRKESENKKREEKGLPKIGGKGIVMTPLMEAMVSGLITKDTVFNGGITQATTELSAKDASGRRQVVTAAMAGTNKEIPELMYPTATTNYGTSIRIPDDEKSKNNFKGLSFITDMINKASKEGAFIDIRYRRISDMRPINSVSQMDSGLGSVSQKIYDNTTRLIPPPEVEVIELP